MARRMIEDKTWKSFQVGQLTFRQRCLWIGLISIADDQGRGYAHPGIVRGSVFPYDDLTNDDLQEDIDHLADMDLITIYRNGNGAPLYQVVNWWRYQRPTWAWPSDLPAPDGWSDREKYRRGNEVIENGWDAEGGFNSDESGPTVTPPRPHDDPTVSPAPSGSGSYSTSSSGSGSGSEDAGDRRNAFQTWERATGTLNPLIAERIGDLVDEFEEHRASLPRPSPGAKCAGDEWVGAAIREAAESTDRFGIKYVAAILDRWKRDGFESERKADDNGNYAIDFGDDDA